MYKFKVNTEAFTFREFVYFDIEFTSKRVEDEDCEHCFVETRKKIKEFFDYADCSNVGKITAEQLFLAVIFLIKVQKS